MTWKVGMNIKRGEIYLACINPVAGKEIAKTCPVVVISNNKNNEFSGTVSILPLNSKHLDKTFPFEVFLAEGKANIPKDSKIKADQIRTIDKGRLLHRIGKVNNDAIASIEKAVKIQLQLL